MLGHQPGARHVERSERLETVLAALADARLSDVETLEAEEVARADLLSVHAAGYLDQIVAHDQAGGRIHLDPDTSMGPGSLRAARRAAGAVIQAVRQVAAGEAERVFCAVRPPGHHALPARAMGFCLFANVAAAAKAAQKAGLTRVAVADFDVHHGNGTQAIFETDENLFLASVHEYPAYPGSGAAEETGRGNIANAPVAPGAEPSTWRAAFEGLVDQIDAFAPDLLIISAGFDAHARDPLSRQSLEAEDYAWATRALVGLAEARCGGRIVSSLEGGYDLQGLGDSVVAHVRALAR
jgi:acetoin utilization deacetylase AcuC-like enzyme